MIDKIIQTLSKKHLLIIGGTKIDRKNLIDKIINQTNYETFRFPKGMKSIQEYVDFVRKENLYQAWYSKKGKFNINQILDFHWDWIAENNSLVVMEEFKEMEERWKLDLLGTYLDEVEHRKKGQKNIHLIISQDVEEDLIDKLCERIRPQEKERRTKRQIVEGSLEIVELF